MSEPKQPIAIASERLTAEISAEGAQLQRLVTQAGEDLQWGGDPAVWKGRAPILFPVIGLLEGGAYRLGDQVFAMPKHGFARDRTFAVAERTPGCVTFRLDADAETRALYPFDFRLELVYAVTDLRLDIEARVINCGDRPMPASFGFHPALRWPLPFGEARSAHRIVFAQPEPGPLRRIDAQGLLRPERLPSPIDGRVLHLEDDFFVDDALIFDRLASRRVVYGGETGPQIAVAFPDFAVLGVWTKPGAGFICIEPWAGLPDPEGFSGDLTEKPGVFIVPAGGMHRLAMSIALLVDRL